MNHKKPLQERYREGSELFTQLVGIKPDEISKHLLYVVIRRAIDGIVNFANDDLQLDTLRELQAYIHGFLNHHIKACDGSPKAYLEKVCTECKIPREAISSEFLNTLMNLLFIKYMTNKKARKHSFYDGVNDVLDEILKTDYYELMKLATLTKDEIDNYQSVTLHGKEPNDKPHIFLYAELKNALLEQHKEFNELVEAIQQAGGGKYQDEEKAREALGGIFKDINEILKSKYIKHIESSFVESLFNLALKATSKSNKGKPVKSRAYLFVFRMLQPYFPELESEKEFMATRGHSTFDKTSYSFYVRDSVKKLSKNWE